MSYMRFLKTLKSHEEEDEFYFSPLTNWCPKFAQNEVLVFTVILENKYKIIKYNRENTINISVVHLF